MTCATCAAIGDGVSANTGRDERLPASAYAVQRLGWGDSTDLAKCPACGALFLCDDYVAQTGSGNNDSASVTRLPAQQSDIISLIAFRGEGSVDDLNPLPGALRDLVIDHLLRSNRDLLRQFVPWMVRQVLADPHPSYTLNTTLYEMAKDPAAAKRILEQIGDRSDDRLRYLRARCVEASATTTQS